LTLIVPDEGHSRYASRALN